MSLTRYTPHAMAPGMHACAVGSCSFCLLRTMVLRARTHRVLLLLLSCLTENLVLFWLLMEHFGLASPGTRLRHVLAHVGC